MAKKITNSSLAGRQVKLQIKNYLSRRSFKRKYHSLKKTLTKFNEKIKKSLNNQQLTINNLLSQFLTQIRAFQKRLNEQGPKTKKLIPYSLYSILLLLLIASLWPRYGLKKAAWKVAEWPNQARLHLDLAKEAAQNHNLKLAQKEVSLANHLDPHFVAQYFCAVENILGEKVKRNNIKKEIYELEEVIQKYPGFRDAYLRLALLYWQIYDDLKADVYLQKASLISPHYPPISRIKQYFKNNPSH